MNIKLDIDITPEEMRHLMGLPDVQPFHDELMDKLRVAATNAPFAEEELRTGAEGYDPLTLFKPYMGPAVNSMEMFQRFMTGVMSGGDHKSEKKQK